MKRFRWVCFVHFQCCHSLGDLRCRLMMNLIGQKHSKSQWLINCCLPWHVSRFAWLWRHNCRSLMIIGDRELALNCAYEFAHDCVSMNGIRIHCKIGCGVVPPNVDAPQPATTPLLLAKFWSAWAYSPIGKHNGLTKAVKLSRNYTSLRMRFLFCV